MIDETSLKDLREMLNLESKMLLIFGADGEKLEYELLS